MADQCLAGLHVRRSSAVRLGRRERKNRGLIAKRVEGLSPVRR
jgi:hypothetical protein